MFCSSCGAQVEEGSKFCDKCGASLEVTNSAVALNHQSQQNIQHTVQTSQIPGQQLQSQYILPHPPTQPKERVNTAEKPKKGPGNGTLAVVIVTTLLLVIGTATVILLLLFRGGEDTEVSEQTTDSGNISQEIAGDIPEVSELPGGEAASDSPEGENGDDIASAVDATMAARDEIDKSVAATQAAKNAEATQAAKQAEDAMATQAAIQAANEYIIPDSDSRYLSINDLRGLTKEECRIARNEIVARKGRKFKDHELQEYFESKSWYNGYIEADKFNENDMLSDIERENMYLIKDYENNYNRYN